METLSQLLTAPLQMEWKELDIFPEERLNRGKENARDVWKHNFCFAYYNPNLLIVEPFTLKWSYEMAIHLHLFGEKELEKSSMKLSRS